MDNFFLWQPVLVSDSPAVVELVITPAESNRIGRGDQALVDTVTGAIGLPLTTTWSIHPIRSPYYSEFLDGEWEDRWPISWVLSLEYAAAPKVPRVDDPIGTNVRDSSWSVETSYQSAKAIQARVIGELKAPPDVSALKSLGNAIVIESPNGMHRVHVDLGEWPVDEFESRLPSGERVIDALVKAGASINHNQSFRLLHS